MSRRRMCATLLLAAGLCPAAASGAELPSATSVASDRASRYALVTADRQVVVLDSNGRSLGRTALPGDPAREDPFRPPQVVGVVDGGAVVGYWKPGTPIAGGFISGRIDRIGYFRPGAGFRWLCGTPNSETCPNRRGGFATIVAVGRRWAWFVLGESGEEWVMRFEIDNDDELRWRVERDDEIEDGVAYADGHFAPRSAATPLSGLDAPLLRRAQRWGYEVRAKFFVLNESDSERRASGSRLQLRARQMRRPAYVTWPQREVSCEKRYCPSITFGARGVAWSTGGVVWFWDKDTSRLWKRPAPQRATDDTAAKLAVTATTLMIGTTSDEDPTDFDTQVRLKTWNLPRDNSRTWTAVRRLRAQQRVFLGAG